MVGKANLLTSIHDSVINVVLSTGQVKLSVTKHQEILTHSKASKATLPFPFCDHKKSCTHSTLLGFAVHSYARKCDVCSPIYKNKRTFCQHKAYWKPLSRSKYPRSCLSGWRQIIPLHLFLPKHCTGACQILRLSSYKHH